jgi:hypothetical protein
MLVVHWTYRNLFGEWSIARDNEGRWHPLLSGECLGSFHSPEAALECLCLGACWHPACGLDPALCGIPETLDQWEAIRQDIAA